LAAAAVAAAVISLNVTSDGSRPLEVVTGPPSSSFLRAAAAACADADAASMPDTAPGSETASQPVISQALSGSFRYVLGPADLDTRAISAARAVPHYSGQSWSVEVTFTATGTSEFNLIASKRYPYYDQNPADPPYASLEALEVNSVVISAPTIAADRFNGTATFSAIGAAPFSKQQADQMVRAIQYDIAHQ
jgi:hypothetical protein